MLVTTCLPLLLLSTRLSQTVIQLCVAAVAASVGALESMHDLVHHSHNASGN